MTSRRPRFARSAGLALALGCGALLGCAESGNYWMEVEGGEGDYVTVECDPPGNAGGFRLEFPRCYCNGGIELSWVVKSDPDARPRSAFVLRRGYLSEETPEITVVSVDGREVTGVFVRGADGANRPLDREADAEEWRRNERRYREIVGEFRPRLYEIERYCSADRERSGRAPDLE